MHICICQDGLAQVKDFRKDRQVTGIRKQENEENPYKTAEKSRKRDAKEKQKIQLQHKAKSIKLDSNKKYREAVATGLFLRAFWVYMSEHAVFYVGTNTCNGAPATPPRKQPWGHRPYCIFQGL